MVGLLMCNLYFYPRSPCGERLQWEGMRSLSEVISIHALLAESDKDTLTDDVSTGGFLLAESDPGLSGPAISVAISIHALLAESDRLSGYLVGVYSYFYPRSPCGERLLTGGSSCDDGNFYPRSPCGERRSNQPVTMRTWKFLSTLSLRRATQAANGLANAPPEISIHALLAESDTRRTYHKDESQEFLSTLSLRRATGILAISLRIVFAEFLSTLSLRRATAFSFALLYSTTISIHALLAESD